jgi:hypothetical protein
MNPEQLIVVTDCFALLAVTDYNKAFVIAIRLLTEKQFFSL